MDRLPVNQKQIANKGDGIMDYITWCKLFSVKIPTIDQQHRRLFDIINDFHEGIRNNEPREFIFDTLNELIQFTDYHFQDEIRLLAASHYPKDQLEKHKEIHEKLILDIFELHRKYTQNEPQTLYEIEAFLNNWIIRHVLEVDKKYQPFITSKINDKK